MQEKTYRTAAVIDLGALRENVQNIRRQLRPGVQLTAVVKADAYGHGAAKIYPVLRQCGVERYAVAMWQEGAALRQAGVTEPILILGDTADEEMEKVLEYDLEPAIFTLSMAQRLEEAARKFGRTVRVHIKLDTGMGRIGFVCTQESAREILQIGRMRHLKIEGLFTHFARADETDKTYAREQYASYEKMERILREQGLEIPLRQVDNSAAIMEMKGTQQTMVRAGIILYGLYPSPEVDRSLLKLRPVLSWRAHVSYVKTVETGTPISYGGTWTASRRSVIATIPVGYADGYNRGLSNRGYVLIHGKKAPICGRVCMDQFMVDVTEIPGVERGTPVTLLGEGMDAEQMAELLGTISYEVLCAISSRVPRIYQE